MDALYEARRIAANSAILPSWGSREQLLNGRSHDVREGGIRDHSFVAMIDQYSSNGGDNDSKDDKDPANGVNLRRVFRIARLVQVCHSRPPLKTDTRPK